jgi:hypothetical protein
MTYSQAPHQQVTYTREANYHMSLNLELEFEMVKCFFFYTHASKTQEFNHKMNVVNLKANMGFFFLIYIIIYFQNALNFHNVHI